MDLQTIMGYILASCIITIVTIYSVVKIPFTALPSIKYVYGDSERYVIYVCDSTHLCGGWADRQKGIVSAYVMAQMMGRRYGIRITSPCDLSTHLTSNEVQWEIRDSDLKGLSFRRIQLLDSATNSLRHKMSYMNLSSEYKEDVIYFASNMDYVESMMNNSLYFEQTKWMRKLDLCDLYVNILRKLFTLKPALQMRFSNFSNDIRRDEGVKLACSHIRLGKNPTIPKDSDVINKRESVSVVWTFLTKYNDTSKYRIFVASDAEDVRAEARLKFPETIIDLEGPIVHVERNRGSHVCGGFAKVILDQLLLSTCDVLIISRKSGFGRVASWYRGKTDGVYCFDNGRVETCNSCAIGWN